MAQETPGSVPSTSSLGRQRSTTPDRPAAKNPLMDGSGGWLPPELNQGMLTRDIASYGLRQYSGWVREEFLPQLVGREASRVFREMADNNPTIGAMLFAIQQAMRKVEWRVETPDDRTESKAEEEFVTSCMHDMSHTWEDFVDEALSCLRFGFSVHEIVYKQRMGGDLARKRRGSLYSPTGGEEDKRGEYDLPISQFKDGRIGWRRLPIRGQETILKWFFDVNGQVTGVTQQPWVGSLIDLPIEKMLLFRPTGHKNNPEGRSVLRNCYRPYWFINRLEEMEAILFERFSGFPVMYVPNEVLEAANSQNPVAMAALASYKNLVTNVRINEQAGLVLPSDPWIDAEGKVTSVRKFEFQLLTPAGGRSGVDVDKTIARHQINMLMTLLTDFVQMGHEVRGTNNLASTKVDMFYNAIEGWLNSIAAVLNRFALPRLWHINNLDFNTMPCIKPDMAARIDLDGLGGFIKNLADAGMPLFPDEDLQQYIRDAAGLPDITSPEAMTMVQEQHDADTAPPPTPTAGKIGKMLWAALAKEIVRKRRTG